MARSRGAPAAAAELLDLAIGLGGGTPERRILSAAHHFDAGEPARARLLLQDTIERLEPGPRRAEAYDAARSCRFAQRQLRRSRRPARAGSRRCRRRTRPAGRDPGVIVVRIGQRGAYALAVQHIEAAVTRATELGDPHALSQALGMRMMLHFMCGEGVDARSLDRAIELEDSDADVSSAFSPRVQCASAVRWTGDAGPGTATRCWRSAAAASNVVRRANSRSSTSTRC